MRAGVGGLAHSRAQFRGSMGAGAWLNATGLTAATAAMIGLGLESEEPGRLVLLYPQRGEDGVAVVGRLEVRPDGSTIAAARGTPAPLWSSPPFEGAEVVVAPDPLCMWLLLQALGPEGPAPLLVAARTPGAGLPSAWNAEEHWTRFASITLLMDDPGAADELTRVFSTMAGIDVSCALPPSGASSWHRHLPTVRDDAGRIALRGLIEEAPSLSCLVPPSGGQVSRTSYSARSVHDLDAAGRMRRVIVVEEQRAAAGAGDVGSRQAVLVARSDGSLLRVAQARAPNGTRRRDRIATLSDGDRIDAMPGAGAACTWSLASAQAFAGGRAQIPGDAEIRSAVTDHFLAAGIGMDAARTSASFVMMSHVYPALTRLPLLIATIPDPRARSWFARTMRDLCHNGRLLGPARARPTARLADATGGTIVLLDPGPLLSPTGATEVGRFVLSSLAPDASLEHEIVDGGARALRTFGPRIVCSAREPLLDWPDVIGLSVGGHWRAAPAPVDRDGTLVDRLHLWAMGAVAGIRSAVVQGADGAELLGLMSAGPVAAAESQETVVEGAKQGGVSPDDILREALADIRTSTGAEVTITQLVLEAALRGGEGNAFSPERIGRWLCASGRLEAGSEVQRRRLFGQITRIYRLRAAAGDGLAGSAFAFCEDTPCSTCRYRGPCARLMPILKSEKLRRTRRH